MDYRPFFAVFLTILSVLTAPTAVQARENRFYIDLQKFPLYMGNLLIASLIIGLTSIFDLIDSLTLHYSLHLTGYSIVVFALSVTITSTSFERMHRGTASIPPKALNRTHFPSMTGIPASGPTSHFAELRNAPAENRFFYPVGTGGCRTETQNANSGRC